VDPMVGLDGCGKSRPPLRFYPRTVQRLQTYIVSELKRLLYTIPAMQICKSVTVVCIEDNLQMTMYFVEEMLSLLSCLTLTLRLLMSYIYGAPSKARNANVVYIWTYVWQR